MLMPSSLSRMFLTGSFTFIWIFEEYMEVGNDKWVTKMSSESEEFRADMVTGANV
jgi:hypothetical protein